MGILYGIQPIYGIVFIFLGFLMDVFYSMVICKMGINIYPHSLKVF